MDKKNDYCLNVNENILNFHRSRTMFVIDADGVLHIHEKGSALSHKQWFKEIGVDFENVVRGFVYENNIYFYRGENFDVDRNSIKLMCDGIKNELITKLNLTGEIHLYGGMIKDTTKILWDYKKEIICKN